MRASIIAALFLLVQASLAANATECDITPPPGFTNHGDCNILCRRTEWNDLLVFYVANYLAHAATVNSQPGQSIIDTIYTSFLVLLFPVAGIVTAYESMRSLAVFASTDLQRAARAGALYMVHHEASDQHSCTPQAHYRTVSSTSRPNNLREKTESVSIWEAKFHGFYRLPNGYTLVPVPKDAKFENDPEGNTKTWQQWLTFGLISLFRPLPRRMVLAYNYCFIKILVSIMQLLFASVTLYRAKGNQIEVYGYAAFGLTVIPYAWMSFLNLCGSVLRPEYPSRFLVESRSLDELRKEIETEDKEDEFYVRETVGRLHHDTEVKINDESTGHRPLGKLLLLIISCLGVSIIVGLVPVVAIFWIYLSYGAPETVNDHQDVWIALWIVFGFAGSFFLLLQRGHVWRLVGQILRSTSIFLEAVERKVESHTHERSVFRRVLHRWILALHDWLSTNHGLIKSSDKLVFLSRRDVTTLAAVLLPIFWAAPAVMGFYSVGKMIMEYGVCTRVT